MSQPSIDKLWGRAFVSAKTFTDSDDLPRERMRVLQVGKFYHPQRGGIESHVKTLCDCLRTEISVEVLVSNTGCRTTRDLCHNVPVSRVARMCHINSTPINPTMIAVIRAWQGDIIHLHWPNPMSAIAYLASGHRGKLVVTYHCDVIKQRVAGWLFSPILNMLLRRADAIIVSSKEYLETSAVLAPYREQCHIIPFGIASSFFSDPDHYAVKQVRQRFGSELILSVGRLVEYKGLDLLIRAVAHTTGTLLLVGDGPRKTKLLELAHSLQLQDRVLFLGELPDYELRTLYHAADLLVLASLDRSEAFGLVQAEAMAAGTPVINTELHSGTTSVSVGDSTGLTVRHSDVPALAHAIHHLLEDATLRHKLGNNARARAEQHFRASTMCASTLALYRQVITENRPILNTSSRQQVIVQ